MAGCTCEIEKTEKLERKTLITLLAINAAMFVVEFLAGWLAESTGLIADSLDMFADASVYAIGLYAVGKSHLIKSNAAMVCGISQIILGLGVVVDVIRRFLTSSNPDSVFMITIGILALSANVICFAIISKHRDGGVHMRATYICSRNDVIANSGVIVAGGLVNLMNNRIPDLLIGAAIAFVVIKGGFTIIQEARIEKRR
jgi:Co/Zn/Cd efflux system component